MMIIAITFVHVVVCFFLIIVVLLQSGKSADLAGTFGGMGSQTAFGPRGAATILSKATTISAIIFMLTSITLVALSSRRGGRSVFRGTAAQSQPNRTQAPAAPPTSPAPAQPATPSPTGTKPPPK